MKSILNTNNILKRLSSSELEYWLGVAQSDGHFKKNKSGSCYICLGIGKKSLPMFNRFVIISKKLFQIKGSIYSTIRHGREEYQFGIGCKKYLGFFKELGFIFDKFILPPVFINNSVFIGAYLAGILDVDGDIRITRPDYPQCFIKISSGQIPLELTNLIKQTLNCGVHHIKNSQISYIDKRKFFGTTIRTEFNISPKNFDFFEKNIIPFIEIKYKRKKLKKYIEMRKGR